MTITNGYATLTEVKAAFDGTHASAYTGYDATIERVIEAVSREIDNHCGRTFYPSATTAARYYTPLDYRCLMVDDVTTVSSVCLDQDGTRTWASTMAATDYDLTPFNAAADGQPYTQIEITPNGHYTFPVGIVKSVRVIGTFGYCASTSATPKPVNEACIIQSTRIYMRRAAPFGVVGNAEMGQQIVIPKFDPDVEMLLAPYVRHV